MKTFRILTATCIALVSLSACNTRKGITVATNPDRVITTTATLPAHIPPTLVGQWAIVTVEGQEVTASEDEYPTVTFDNADTGEGVVNMYANNGCNYINGSFTVKGNFLVRNGDFAATMKYCPDAKYEIPITMALEKTGAFSIEKLNNEYFLTLKNVDGTPVMTLRKHNLAFLDGAWRVTALQGVEVKATQSPELVIDLADGKVHGNAGCNVVNGTVTQNLDREGGIGFTNLFTTRMSCPDLAIEQSFLVALEQVESCVPGENNNTALLKDGAGQTIITMQRIEITQE